MKSDVFQLSLTFNLRLTDPCQGPQNFRDSQRKDVDMRDFLVIQCTQNWRFVPSELEESELEARACWQALSYSMWSTLRWAEGGGPWEHQSPHRDQKANSQPTSDRREPAAKDPHDVH